MAEKFMQMVLTPAVQRAQDKYFGKHQVMVNAPEMDALTPTKSTSSLCATASTWRP